MLESIDSPKADDNTLNVRVVHPNYAGPVSGFFAVSGVQQKQKLLECLQDLMGKTLQAIEEAEFKP